MQPPTVSWARVGDTRPTVGRSTGTVVNRGVPTHASLNTLVAGSAASNPASRPPPLPQRDRMATTVVRAEQQPQPPQRPPTHAAMSPAMRRMIASRSRPDMTCGTVCMFCAGMVMLFVLTLVVVFVVGSRGYAWDGPLSNATPCTNTCVPHSIPDGVVADIVARYTVDTGAHGRSLAEVREWQQYVPGTMMFGAPAGVTPVRDGMHTRDACSKKCVCSRGGISVYGRYCGFNYYGCNNEPPCDAADACCMIHDRCTTDWGRMDCDCGRALTTCLERAFACPDNTTASSGWRCNTTAEAILWMVADARAAFTPCYLAGAKWLDSPWFAVH